ncbi:MAG: DUF5812 family protein [Halobacteriales archaeon]|nr:DUF5812 family protein [Halobacteriales archaeon]
MTDDADDIETADVAGGDEATTRYVVTHADADSAVLRDIDSGQVHTLADNPGVEAGDVLDATLAPEPPLEIADRIVDVDERRHVRRHESNEPPTAHEQDLAADQDVGELTREERAGMGEIHVITVPAEETADAVEDVLDDDGTLERAGRMENVARVEVRSDEETGTISVRYLP